MECVHRVSRFNTHHSQCHDHELRTHAPRSICLWYVSIQHTLYISTIESLPPNRERDRLRALNLPTLLDRARLRLRDLTDLTVRAGGRIRDRLLDLPSEKGDKHSLTLTVHYIRSCAERELLRAILFDTKGLLALLPRVSGISTSIAAATGRL